MPKDMSGAEARLLRQLRKRAYRLQGGRCYWCKEPMHVGPPMNHPRQLSGDHLTPRHASGQTLAHNIVAACRTCNSERHPELARGTIPADQNGVVYSVGEPSNLSPFAALRKTRT